MGTLLKGLCDGVRCQEDGARRRRRASDGGQHTEERDAERDAWLEAQGYRVLRFWNSDVMADMVAVAETILSSRRIIPLSPTHVGEREG